MSAKQRQDDSAGEATPAKPEGVEAAGEAGATEPAGDADEAVKPQADGEDLDSAREFSADFSVRAGDDRFRASGRERPLGDLASRLLRVGAEAVTQTTGRLREAGEDVRPRDLVSGAVRMTAKGREELVGMVAREVRLYLEKLRVGEELRSLMTDHSLEINASVRLKPLTGEERDESSEEPGASKPDPEPGD